MGPAGAPYCVPADLVAYIPPPTLARTTTDIQMQACVNATEEADSYLRGRYALPLTAWGNDVRRYTAWIAVYLIVQQIGFRPGAGADENIVKNYYRAVGDPMVPGSGWFPGIQRQAIHPDVTPSVPPGQDPVRDLPQVSTAPMRGWEQTRNGRPVVG